MSLVTLGLMTCLASVAMCGEEEVLNALDDVRAGIVGDVSHDRLSRLLDSARAEVETLRKGVGNDCFRAAARQCYAWYAQGVSSWGSLLENEKQREKYARQAEYGERHLKGASLSMSRNYGKLVNHARDALPSTWMRGHAQLERARECLNGQGLPR
jgi:hypothetical protein